MSQSSILAESIIILDRFEIRREEIPVINIGYGVTGI